jgi:hypothetical protein
MAGFREFVTGEVLTAANVDDFLAKQAVMKFADAAARDAALGTAVAGGNALREGMVAWLDSDDSVIAYDGSAWNPVGAEPPAGIGSNVVQTVKTDTFTTANTTFTDVTGLAVTITPSSATAKVLVIAQIAYGLGADAAGPIFRMTRDGNAVYVGDAASNRTRAVFGGRTGSAVFDTMVATGSIVFLDSPAQATATVYQIQALQTPLTGGTVCVNRSTNDGDFDQRVRGASSITVIEVAA